MNQQMINTLEIIVFLGLFTALILIFSGCANIEVKTGQPPAIEAGQVWTRSDHGAIFTNRVLSVSGDYANVATSWSIFKTERKMHVAVLRYNSKMIN